MRYTLSAAVRSFRSKPLVPGLVVVTLALGIGLAGAMVSIIDALVLRPLPFAVADRLVDIQVRRLTDGQSGSRLDVDIATLLRERRDLFDTVEQYQFGFATLAGIAEPRAISTPQVTPGLLAVLGAVPLHGRLFVEEDRAATVPVALISESLWRGGFGADPGIVGRDITLDDAHYHVVGVLPSSFRYPEARVEVWRALPPSAAPLDVRGGRGAMVTVALLANGVTSRQADAELLAMSDRLRQTSRLRADQLLVTDRPLQQRAMDRYKPALFAMLGAVMLVLMMAAINVVNLLLVRGSARAGECAILAALGASRAGLAARAVAEAVALALVGAVLGLVLARALLAAIAAIQPEQLSFLSGSTPTLTPLVVSLTVIASTFICVLVSALPAWRATRVDLVGALQHRSPRLAGHADERWQSAFLSLQIGLVLVVLTLAATLLTSFVRVMNAPQGYDPSGLTVAEFQFSTPAYRSPRVALDLLRTVDTAVETQWPGAQSTLAVGLPPVGGMSAGGALEIDGRAVAPAEATTWTYTEVAPDYFATMKITIVAGRTFAAVEDEPAIILNDVMARRFWGAASPIGSRVRYRPTDPWRTVVGVVADVRQMGVIEELSGGLETYVPFSPDQRLGTAHLVVRTAAEGAAGRLRDLLRVHEADVPVRVMSMEARMADSQWQPRFFVRLSVLFAAAAVLVGIVGVYGVAAYRVLQRRREFAVRVAVGATPGQLALLVFRRLLLVAGVGIMVAVPVALSLAPVVQPMLYLAVPADPVALTGALTVLMLLVVTGGTAPAVRAARTDPATTLKSE